MTYVINFCLLAGTFDNDKQSTEALSIRRNVMMLQMNDYMFPFLCFTKPVHCSLVEVTSSYPSIWDEDVVTSDVGLFSFF